MTTEGHEKEVEERGHTESPDIRAFSTPSLSSGTTDSTFAGNLGTGSAKSTSSLSDASCKAALLLSNLLCSNNDGSITTSVLPLFRPIHHSPPILRSLSYEYTFTPNREDIATVGETWAEYADEMKPIRGL